MERWPLSGGAAVRDELLAAYGDASRGYHDRRHLAEVLDRLAELAGAGVRFSTLPVTLAAWFHDAVYAGRDDDEERSAAWAERVLPGLVDDPTVAEVARLVRLTACHRPGPGDVPGAALCDADLAVLAAEPPRYAAYVAGVRRDFAHVADADFTRGRAAVLRELLAGDRLFNTPYGRERWEALARANLQRELEALTGSGPTDRPPPMTRKS